jgi:mRNA interferase RelE/StbE
VTGYAVHITGGAEKDIADLHPDVRAAVDRRVLELGQDSRPHGAKPLKGRLKGLWRVRAGEHRIVYAVDDRARTVTVYAVGPRGGIYS